LGNPRSVTVAELICDGLPQLLCAEHPCFVSFAVLPPLVPHSLLEGNCAAFQLVPPALGLASRDPLLYLDRRVFVDPGFFRHDDAVRGKSFNVLVHVLELGS